MNLLEYYGVDWLLFALVFIHLWMLGNRIRSAFLLGVAANACGFVFGWMTGSIATLIMNVVFCLLNIRAYIKWRDIHGQEKIN
jgi:hypothetical protein